MVSHVSIMTVLCVYSMAGVPLTTSNVLVAVERVMVGLNNSLRDLLYMPASKEREIQKKKPSNVDKEVILYWINTDPLASWRRIIVLLDLIRETELADIIRSNAEPLTGMCIICMYY